MNKKYTYSSVERELEEIDKRLNNHDVHITKLAIIYILTSIIIVATMFTVFI